MTRSCGVWFCIGLVVSCASPSRDNPVDPVSSPLLEIVQAPVRDETTGHIEMSWRYMGASVARYRVFRAAPEINVVDTLGWFTPTAPGVSPQIRDVQPVQLFVDTGTAAGAIVEYTVEVEDESELGVVALLGEVLIPGVQLDDVLLSPGPLEARVLWTPVPEPGWSYEVVRSSGGADSVLFTTTGSGVTAFTDTDVPLGTVHTYLVRGTKASGQVLVSFEIDRGFYVGSSRFMGRGPSGLFSGGADNFVGPFEALLDYLEPPEVLRLFSDPEGSVSGLGFLADAGLPVLYSEDSSISVLSISYTFSGPIVPEASGPLVPYGSSFSPTRGSGYLAGAVNPQTKGLWLRGLPWRSDPWDSGDASEIPVVSDGPNDEVIVVAGNRFRLYEPQFSSAGAVVGYEVHSATTATLLMEDANPSDVAWNLDRIWAAIPDQGRMLTSNVVRASDGMILRPNWEDLEVPAGDEPTAISLLDGSPIALSPSSGRLLVYDEVGVLRGAIDLSGTLDFNRLGPIRSGLCVTAGSVFIWDAAGVMVRREIVFGG